MKYLINSTEEYSEHSLNLLIPTLLESGISPKNILVIMGGSEEETDIFSQEKDYSLLKTKINAFDMTSFYVMNFKRTLFGDNCGYFYLHDTTSVEKDFKQKIEGAWSGNSCRLCSIAACNMGFYTKKDIIEAMENETVRNCDDYFLKEKNLNTKKQKAIQFEDIIYKTLNIHCSLSERHYIDKKDVYKTKNPRTVSYFPQMSLYKYSANADLGESHPLTTMIGISI